MSATTPFSLFVRLDGLQELRDKLETLGPYQSGMSMDVFRSAVASTSVWPAAVDGIANMLWKWWNLYVKLNIGEFTSGISIQ